MQSNILDPKTPSATRRPDQHQDEHSAEEVPDAPAAQGPRLSRRRRLLHLRIGVKIALGFAAVLILTASVAFVGWSGLTNFGSQVKAANDSNAVVRTLLETRIDEKNFQIRGDEKFIEAIAARIALIHESGIALRNTVRSQADQQMVDRLLAAVDAYHAAFTKYADLQKSKDRALAAMVEEAGSFQDLAGQIEEDQKITYQALQQRVDKLELTRDDRRTKAEDANQLLALVGTARRDEMEFLLTGEEVYAQSARRGITQVLELSETLKQRFDSDEVKVQIDQVMAAARTYQAGLAKLIEVVGSVRDSSVLADAALSDAERQGRIVQARLTTLQSKTVAPADGVARLGAYLGDVRLATKDFLLSTDQKLAERIASAAQEFVALTAELKTVIGGEAAKLLDEAAEGMKNYAASFKTVFDVRVENETSDDRKKAALDEMVNSAREFEALVSQLRLAQEDEYQLITGEVAKGRAEMSAKLLTAGDANRLIKYVGDARQAEKDFLLRGNPEDAALVERAIAFILPLTETMETRFDNPDDQELAVTLRGKAAAYGEKFKEVVTLTGQQATADAAMAEAANSVNEMVVKAGEDQQSAMVAQQSRSNTLMIIGTLVALGLGAVFAFLIGRGISRPINEMTGAMKRLADGDLDVEVPAQGRKDEIGEMAGAVQVFKENALEKVQLEAEQEEREKRAETEKRQAMMAMADAFEASVGQVVEQVSSASTEMQSSSEAMNATAEETTRQAAAVAAASEEASTNVETVASAAEELSSSISEIGRQVMHASQVARAAVEEAQETNLRIQGLAEAAQKIGEVVALITDIADQTNLLALNATIEAARAGDAGKGFAVVASEVKNLANQTARATEEIGAQISGIQESTQRAVEAIAGIGKTIAEIDEVASGIASAVEEQGAATQEIARNVEQAAAGTHEVSSNITGVSQAANETGEAARQIQSAAGELSQQSERLRVEVAKFLSGVRSA